MSRVEEGARTGRYELTAAQWQTIEANLPMKAGDRGRTAADNRTLVNTVKSMNIALAVGEPNYAVPIESSEAVWLARHAGSHQAATT
jgi:hypothetical protein